MEVIRRLIVVIIWVVAAPLMLAFFMDQSGLGNSIYSFEWFRRGVQQAMFAFVPACIFHTLVNWIFAGSKKTTVHNERNDPNL